MSLAEETDARKARLLALRKRKRGEDLEEGDVNGYVIFSSQLLANFNFFRTTDIVLSRRNFDSQTRTLRKHSVADEGETVELKAAGLLEEVLAEDESRRVQELV